MIKTVKGDILNSTSGIIVHGCNMQGKFGSGIALQIKEVYPEAYAVYKQCEVTKGLTLGEYSTVDVGDLRNLYIVNMITQQNYGKDGKKYVSYDAIHEGFTKLFTRLEENSRQDLTVRFPAIGAGLGGGDLEVILRIIDSCDPRDLFTKELWVL